MKPELAHYLDARNTGIWNLVSNKYAVSLDWNTESNYGCFSKGTDAVIYISRQHPASKDSFTHELLHLYLKLKSITIGGQVSTGFMIHPSLSIFPDSLPEHIGNCLDHVKMLAKYMELGFDRKKFLHDYDTPKCTTQDIDILKQMFPMKLLNKPAAEIFIGKLIGIRSCPNKDIDYRYFLRELQAINPSLFDIVDAFWNKWEQYDHENYDVIWNDYRGFTDEFISALSDWSSQNITN